MKMYWATIWSKEPDKDESELRKSFFATIEENQYKALLKIVEYFNKKTWLGSKEAIIEIKCESVGELTPDNFGTIKLIP